MFGMFKSDPMKKIRQQYNDKLTEAMKAQRGGDMRKFAELTEEAEKLRAQLESV